MSEQAGFMPWGEECCLIAALLQSAAGKLSRLYDARVEGLLPCPTKGELAQAARPGRELVFEAQKVAYALRLGRPLDDPYEDLPHIFAGHLVCRQGDTQERAIKAVRADIDRAMQLYAQLMDAHQRAMVCDA